MQKGEEYLSGSGRFLVSATSTYKEIEIELLQVTLTGPNKSNVSQSRKCQDINLSDIQGTEIKNKS